MITIGRNLQYGHPSILKVWLASADGIADPAIFLVRSGFGHPAFSRVCSVADMHNYASASEDAAGWQRVTGVEFEIYSAETAGKILDDCERGALALEADLAVSGTGVPTTVIRTPLRVFHTGGIFGYLVVSRADMGTCLSLDISLDLDEASASVQVSPEIFRVSQGAFPEFLGIPDPGSLEEASDSDAVRTSSITVWLNDYRPEVEGQLYSALAFDIEDLYSYTMLGA